MALSYVGGDAASGSSVTLPSFVAGDIALTFAYRDGNNTPPTLHASWTNIASSGASNNSSRLGYRILQTGDTTTGTWTNATEIEVIVLRGQHDTTPIGAHSAGGASSNQISYAALTPTVTTGTSWVAGFAGHRSATDVNSKAVTGMTTRSGAITSLGVHTLAGVGASFTQHDYTTTVSASSGWRSYAVEVVADTPTTTGTARLSLTAGQTPASRTEHSITVRARKTNAAHTGSLQAQLYESASARSTLLDTGNLTTTFASYVLAIADSDAATIGSYADLELRLNGYSTAGDPLVVEVAAASLGLPSPSTGSAFGSVVLPLTFGATTSGAVTASGAKATGVAQVSLDSGFTPLTRTEHAITVRARRTSLQGKIRVQLMEGSTPRGAELETGELTTSLADYTLNLPDADAATITDYANLSLKLRGYSSTGTATPFEIAQASLSLPAIGSGGAVVLGQVVFASISTVSVGADSVVYPGTGIYPHALITLSSTATIQATAGAATSTGQVTLPLTLTRVTAGFIPPNNSGQVLLASTATITIAPISAIARFGAVSFDSVSTITATSATFDQVGAAAFSATATITIAGDITSAPLPADFVASPFPQMPSSLLAVAFTTSPLSSFPVYAGVTTYLRGINTQRGRQFELDRVEAGTEAFLLDNRAGTFSPENTASPYYGNLIPTRKVRFALSWASVVYEIFNGYLEGYPQEYPSYGFDAVVRQQAVDAFMPLAKGKLIPGSTTLTSDMLTIPSDVSPVPLETIQVALTGLPMPQTVPFEIMVDLEVMTVTSIPSPNTYIVQRSAGTEARHTGVHTPIGHTAGAPVTTTAVSFGQEYSGTRIVNVLQRIGLTPAEYDIDAGQSLLAPSEDLAGQNPLEHLNLVAEVEGGRFFTARDGRITFRDRHDQFKNEQSPRATFGDSTGEIHYSDVKPTHDAEKIRNIVRITSADGTVAEVRDEASIDDHFEQVFEKVWPLADANEALAAAQYILGRYSRMQIRVPEILVKGQENPTLDWPHLLALELGQRFRLIRRPTLRSGISGTTIDKEMLVEGVAHQVSPDAMQTRVQLSLADESHYWRLEVVGYGELDSTTRLAY